MTPRRTQAEESTERTVETPNTVELKADSEPEFSDGDLHPIAQKLFQNVPFLEDVPVLGSVLKAYSPRLVSSVCLERTFAKGLANGFMNFSIQPMVIAHFKISGSMCQRIAPLYPLGWSLNTFFAIITDTFAVLGYTKRWFCVVCALGGGVCALLYGMLPAEETSFKGAATLLFLTAVLLANVDTSSSAIYSRFIGTKPTSRAAMVSWALVADIFGTMIAAFVQGPLSDNYMPFIGPYIAAGLLFMLTLLFIFNMFGEQSNRVCRLEMAKAQFLAEKEKQNAAAQSEPFEPDTENEVALTNSDPFTEMDDVLDDADATTTDFVEPEVPSVLWGTIELNMEVLTRNWLMIVYCGVLTAAVVATTTVDILGNKWEVLGMSVAVPVLVCGSAFLALPLAVAKTMTFVFLKNALYLYLPGVLKTFYLAKPACLPDGPHFSFTFFNIMGGVVGNVCSVLGVTLLSQYLQPFSYRGIMAASAFLIPLISIFDLLILLRWNMSMGLPDHVVFVLGNTILYEVVNTLLNAPTMLLMSRVAPRGSESMALALMAGVANLGSAISAAYGHVLLETVWPVTTAGTCDYTDAEWLVVAGHIGTPLLFLPLAFLLLPSSRLSAKLDEHGNEEQ